MDGRNLLQANADGELPDLLKKIGMESRGGSSLAITCSTIEGQISWILEIEYAHLVEGEVKKMIQDLGHPDYQYEVSAEVLSSIRFLEERVNRFEEYWNRLAALFLSIARQPSESIEVTEGVQSIHNSFRLTPQTLRENLRKGLLNAEGKPTGQHIIAQKYQPTLDNAENSYVVRVISLFQNASQALREEVEKENQRLKEEEQRYKNDFGVPKKFGPLIGRTENLLIKLDQLQNIELPETWRSLKSLPNRDTNMVRFSPSYRGVADLDVALSKLDLGIPHERRLRRLGELGQRQTWKLYEYWMVRKMYDALISLRFREENGKGFHALEDKEGALYGLVPGSSMTLKHEDVPDLQICLTYEREFTAKEVMRPDLVLRLQYGDGGKNTTLILDAKYSKLGQYTQNLLEKSARRYRREWEKYQEDDNAMAFLCHLGEEVWPACPEREGQQGILLREDFPFRTGILTMRPRENNEVAMYHAKRLITAWLFRNRIVSICYRCGADMKDNGKIDHLPNDIRDELGWDWGERIKVNKTSEWPRRYPEIEYRCQNNECNLGMKVSFCGSCARNRKRWEPILKLFPEHGKNKGERPEWLDLVDIVRGEGQYRNCPTCGNRY